MLQSRGNNLCEQYEALRAQATGQRPDITTPRGLALFLRQGMPAWISAWSDCAPVTSTTAPRVPNGKDSGLLSSSHSEVAVLLVNMALQAQKEMQLC
jgi:hypothetical protein